MSFPTYRDVNTIVVAENRQRKSINEIDLQKLAESLSSGVGLLHPIVCRKDDQDRYVLVAGERRLRATQLLGSKNKGIIYHGNELEPNTIPVFDIGTLSQLDAYAAELEENIQRTDLTWQERVEATARLNELRGIQNPQHTKKLTAAEILGIPPEQVTPAQVKVQVTDSLILSQNLHRPSVAAAPSAEKAMKALQRELESELRADLVSRVPIEQISSQHTILKGDSREVLMNMLPEQFDCLLTDPPYGIDANRFGDMAELDHEYADNPDYAAQLYSLLAFRGFELCKVQAHAYIFLDHTWWGSVSSLFSKAGWWVWPKPIIWDKGTGMLPHPNHGPRYTYEIILYAIKGHRKAQAVYPDVIRIPNVKEKMHAAQKPVDLYQNLLRRTCLPNNTVLDPFAGSGTIFPAATRERVKATGVELKDDAYNMSVTRLSDKKADTPEPTIQSVDDL